jgi:PhzF family phenazine biosynthesis protein
MPVEVVSTGLPDIIMPVGSVEQLHALEPDMAALAALSKELDVVGVHAFALSDDGFTAHVRNFAPLYGVPEESATGTANAALTHYLNRHGIISCPADCRFMQGEAMRRPSVIEATVDGDGRIWVGGHSCIIATGELL